MIARDGLAWEMLARAIEILGRRDAWLHGFNKSAVTSAGKVCSPLSPTAAKWSLCGALSKAAHETDTPWHIESYARHQIARTLGADFTEWYLYDWNDDSERTHEDVLRVLNQAFLVDVEEARKQADEHLENVRTGALKFIDDAIYPDALARVSRVSQARERVAAIVRGLP